MTIGQSPTRSPGSRSCRHMNATRVCPPAGLMAGWLTMFVVGTDLFVVSPLLPMIAADYRVSPTVAGLCVTVFLLTYMVSAPLFGRVADRMGRARSGGWGFYALPGALVARRLMPMVIWSTGLYGMYTYLGAGLAASGFTTDEIARAILFYGCGALAGVLLGGRLADRFGAKTMAAVSFLGLSACFLVVALAVHAGVLVEIALGLASGVAQLFFPAQQAGLANDFPTRRATMLAWNNSALFFGISLGSLVGGQAIALAGFEANLMVSAGIALSGCIITGVVVLAPARLRPADYPA